MAHKLTEGSLEMIMNGGHCEKPVMQVLDSKKIPGSGANEKFRLVVSDGKHSYSFAVLATRLNNVIITGELSDYSIVKIDQFFTPLLKDTGKGEKRIIIILDLTILATGNEVGKKLGNPQAWGEDSAGSTTTAPPAPHTSPTVPPVPQPTLAAPPAPRPTTAAQPAQRPTPAGQPAPRPTIAAPPASRPTIAAPPAPRPSGAALHAPRPTPAAPPSPRPTSAALPALRPSSTAPPAHCPIPAAPLAPPDSEPRLAVAQNLDSKMTISIASLSPYRKKWVIKARVMNKSAIRTWSKGRDEGKLFSMDLCDDSGEIRAFAFKSECDKFYDMIEINKVYYISCCQVISTNKPRQTKSTSLKNDYELMFTAATVVSECSDHVSSVPTDKSEFVASQELDTLLESIGAIKDAASLQEFTARCSRKLLKKREVSLVDASGGALLQNTPSTSNESDAKSPRPQQSVETLLHNTPSTSNESGTTGFTPRTPQSVETDSPQTVHNTVTKIKPKKRRLSPKFSKADKKNKDVIATSSQVLERQFVEEDDCDVFGKLLAKKLRKHPDIMRQRIMYKIDGLLLDHLERDH